eukprot:scaffold52267_cov40-Phaeocystis_antarctica.AAC.3
MLPCSDMPFVSEAPAMSTTLCCVAVERSRAPWSAARPRPSRCRRSTGGVGGGRRRERDRGTIATCGSACCSRRSEGRHCSGRRSYVFLEKADARL